MNRRSIWLFLPIFVLLLACQRGGGVSAISTQVPPKKPPEYPADSDTVVSKRAWHHFHDRSDELYGIERNSRPNSEDHFRLGWFLLKDSDRDVWRIIHKDRERGEDRVYDAYLIQLWQEGLRIKQELVKRGGPSE